MLGELRRAAALALSSWADVVHGKSCFFLRVCRYARLPAIFVGFFGQVVLIDFLQPGDYGDVSAHAQQDVQPLYEFRLPFEPGRQSHPRRFF